ncbi:MAG TPA: HlyD family type I secretion periplasmic adaptor subunit [Acetobacteraceae bacterium]|nr:HlyD family type I secretion periplasmic adaptor subunit [Acetobacteraceae bacterium]
MQRSLPRSSKGTDLVERDDPALPVILEFQSPSTAVLNEPVPRSARSTVWIISALLASILAAVGLIKVDRTVSTRGQIVSRAPVIVVQPLETAIVREIAVHVGEKVQAGQVLARLDPTFAAADLSAQAAQVSSLQAETTREQAEAASKPFTYTGLSPELSLQAAIFAQRQAEYSYKLENYNEKIEELVSQIKRANSDAQGYRDRLEVAQNVEKMRRELEKLQVGSKLNTLAAMDTRAEMQRDYDNAQQTAQAAARELKAMVAERDGYVQSWHAEVSQKLAESTAKLSDAREQMRKAQLRRQLVELRADHDATVLTLAKVSVGSVLQPGEQFITLMPADAPLEIEANISGRDDGYVQVGDSVAIKFDTFPFARYGMAYGTLRLVSANSFTGQDQQRTNEASSVAVPTNDMEPFYRARVAIDRVALRGVPEGFQLMPGMPVMADIKVGQQTVLHYLLNRVVPVATEAMREP